ncbi:hypothetical protein WR25_23964 [Diploscapter pachys]|uniref:Endoplasmic reticulum oxidoreductin-1 n=1 Tax=Diploscapter pachys TaxID=2018661 RepID=A0A2A2LAJ4_9BILA|nr:hypothetical protein WR25_23964 [Diploscapter pachys]
MRRRCRTSGSLCSWSNFWLIGLLLAWPAAAQFEPKEECFCKHAEAVEPCPCDSSNIDHFNNDLVFDKLHKILQRDFFKFYKVNMDKHCPFWADSRQCGTSQCGIAFCDDEVPEGLRRPRQLNNAVDAVEDEAQCREKREDEESNTFDPVDRSITQGKQEQLKDMDVHDELLEDKFCEVDDDDSSSMHYVDLSKNQERYTGYKGDSAIRVWKSIYQENCFKPDPKNDGKQFLMNPNNFGLCLEKRVFYRLISGLHSAITISIAAYNYRPAPGGLGAGTWFRNTQMFVDRFGTKWSWEGPQRLRNVYFVYLLELRALLKVAPYLEKELFYTGNDKEDQETKQMLEDLFETIKQFPNHFNEKDMFTGVDAQARTLREEFRSHFHNISRIMDCVDCDKCRLWGKVQVHGMGTALKILFSDIPYSAQLAVPRSVDSSESPSSSDSSDKLDGDSPNSTWESPSSRAPFQLTRNELVALLQSFGRYSSSIHEVSKFRRDLYPHFSAHKDGEL